MSSTMTETDLIPVLDVGPLLAGQAGGLDRLGDELRRALEEVGFFFVVNHDVDWALVEGVYDQARRVHALPSDELAAIRISAKEGGYLELGGGTSYASEIAGEVRKPNLNAAYFVHRGGHRTHNQWPELDGFRAAIERYMDAVQSFAHRLLPVYARALDLPADWFDPSFVDPSATLRMSHYPRIDYEEHSWGLAPHTDSSFMTLLPANDVPGLQIRPEGHDWIDPPALARSYLINSGDILRRWTNDRFLSTGHRVRNMSDTDRYAMPFFYGARDDAVVEAIPTCVSAQRPAAHQPITYGEYQRWFLNRNYAPVTGTTASETAP